MCICLCLHLCVCVLLRAFSCSNTFLETCKRQEYAEHLFIFVVHWRGCFNSGGQNASLYMAWVPFHGHECSEGAIWRLNPWSAIWACTTRECRLEEAICFFCVRQGKSKAQKADDKPLTANSNLRTAYQDSDHYRTVTMTMTMDHPMLSLSFSTIPRIPHYRWWPERQRKGNLSPRLGFLSMVAPTFHISFILSSVHSVVYFAQCTVRMIALRPLDTSLYSAECVTE